MSLFTDKAPGIMRDLMRDFNLDDLSAAAIVGNLGHESGGFRFLQEKKPLIPGSKGGYGWAQWTGPRRRLYEAYCQCNSLDPASDKANYGFLFVELTGSEKAAIPAVRNAKEIKDDKGNIKVSALASKVMAFEKAFERAGIKHYPSRNNYTAQALKAYHAAQPPKTTEAKIKDAAKVGAGVVVTGTGAVGANAGWGFAEWALAVGALLIVIGAVGGVWWWLKNRKTAVPPASSDEAEKTGLQAITEALSPPLIVPRRKATARHSAAKKRKPAKKRAA